MEMPDSQTIVPALRWLLALAGLLALFRARRSPLALQLVAIALSLGLVVSLDLHGWPDLSGRVLWASLGLHLPWLLLVLWSRRPWAAALAEAGAWLYGGFYIALGVQSLRHATPLAPGLAVGVILFGIILMLVPMIGRRTGRRTARRP